SRRRHTRSKRDWSSDVCSSDLRVKQNLENRTISLNLEEYIFESQVPMEDVVEIKNGQRKQVRRVRMPGYVLVRMELTDESWGAVRHTPGVTGFVGNAYDPTP